MKLALCNEVLRDMDFAGQCRTAASLGYAALELAPFTFSDDPSTLTERDAARWAAEARAHDLRISSLHWLLVRPAGLSLTTADQAVRRRTIELLRHLIVLAAVAGADVLVHGSPAQRSPQPGQSVADALARVEAALVELAAHAASAGVTYCLEPLARNETPVINTVAEAAALVDRIGAPSLRTMLDVSAASQAESEAPAAVLRKYLASGHIAHVQLNDRNRRGPGQGDTPIAPVLAALFEAGYGGWMAVEPFEYVPDGPGCAAASAAHVRGLMRSLAIGQRPVQ